ncbi:MAG: hypothetical protein H6918_04095 [Sphingomonadaceae bacterium]|nr:hypothetical protein [Sphingomonadaceae bacterium]
MTAALGAMVLFNAGTAAARPWIVQYDGGPVAPVESCETIETEDGFKHVANGHELPSGFICDDIPMISGGGRDVVDVRKSPAIKRMLPGAIKPEAVCPTGVKCPPPPKPAAIH